MNIVSLKQSLHMAFRSKLHIFACVASLLLLCSTVSMRADVNDCTCNVDSTLATNLTICIGGTNYVVDIFGCKRDAPPLLAPICAAGSINQYTTITKVCFVGVRPIPIDPAATLSAILCELDPCKTPGILGATVGPTFLDVYCWAYFLPRCVRVDNLTGCIIKCGDGCCVVRRDFTRQADGSCLPTLFAQCTTAPTACISPCVQIDCVEPVCCN